MIARWKRKNSRPEQSGPSKERTKSDPVERGVEEKKFEEIWGAHFSSAPMGAKGAAGRNSEGRNGQRVDIAVT